MNAANSNPQEKLKLVGIHEIAEMANVSTSCVCQWRTRYQFPAPVAELRCGAIFLRSDIKKWLTLRAESTTA